MILADREAEIARKGENAVKMAVITLKGKIAERDVIVEEQQNQIGGMAGTVVLLTVIGVVTGAVTGLIVGIVAE